MFQAHADTATLIMKNVYSPLLEVAGYKKSQTKKLYSFRENFDSMLNANEDSVSKVRENGWHIFSVSEGNLYSPVALELGTVKYDITNNTTVQNKNDYLN